MLTKERDSEVPLLELGAALGTGRGGDRTRQGHGPPEPPGEQPAHTSASGMEENKCYVVCRTNSPVTRCSTYRELIRL